VNSFVQLLRRLEPGHWIALGTALLLLPLLGRGALHQPWEQRHAGIAARMAEDGPSSAFTPTLDDEAYLERPPAAYWPAALATKLFGAGTFAARVPSALAGILLVWGVYVTVRRARGKGPAAIVAGVAATTPLAMLLFRSALPEALALAASSGSFLALAAAAVDPATPSRVAWAGWLLLGLAAGLGGLPAVAPPLVAVILFALLGGRRPAWGALRPVAGLGAAAVVAAALLAPAFVLHGPAATRALVRPDVAEESPVEEEKLEGRPRPDDRMGFDTDLEATAWGAFPWSALLPAALIGLALRRRSDGEIAPAASDFDFACLLWLVASFGTTALLGDRFHHDPYGALVPLAVVVGLYVSRKVDGEWSSVDAILVVAGLGLLVVGYRDLSGGAHLAQAANYFAPPLPGPIGGIAWPLRLALLGSGAVLVLVLLLRRWRWWLAAAAVAAALAWTLGAVHVLAPAMG
jgi:4-amino-4-deoxy-L-arabinose transferase-like glycosyltransferase